MTEDMVQDLADMLDVNGHDDVSVLDLLDCMCDLGLKLAHDPDGEAGRLYAGIIQKATTKRSGS